jgi:hypothetical protein
MISVLEVSGTANIYVNYSITIDLTEAEWDEMSPAAQTEYLDNHVDWMDACRSGSVEDIDIDDVKEMDEEESA